MIDNGATPDDGSGEETIDASAWQMWMVVYRTCGLPTALRTALNYGWMRLKGKA